LKALRCILCFSFIVLTMGCLSDSHIPFTHDKQCQEETIVPEKAHKDKSLNCLEFPYYNDKNESIELLRFILHGDNNAKLVNDQPGRMQILHKPSVWQREYLLQINFYDNAQLMKICSENSSGWFASSKHFLLALQQEYLNVAKKG